MDIYCERKLDYKTVCDGILVWNNNKNIDAKFICSNRYRNCDMIICKSTTKNCLNVVSFSDGIGICKECQINVKDNNIEKN